MIKSNLAYDYVHNIPWDKNPAFAFSKDSESYMRSFENVVDKIPVKNSKISFEDDIWDFRPYFKGLNDYSIVVKFVNLPLELKNYSKFFILYKIMNSKKISTANLRYIKALSVINNIIKKNKYKNIHLITTNDIVDEVTGRDIALTSIHNMYGSVYQYYYFLINNYKLNLPVDIDHIKELGIKAKKQSKIKKIKIPNIPEEFFSIILKTAVSEMRNEKSEHNRRSTACLLVMLTQLGLRLGDLLSLEINQLHSKSLSRINKIAYYLHYKSRKPSKPNDAMLEFDIFSNDLCTEAFNTLKIIRKNCEFSKKYDYLYVLNRKGTSTNQYPLTKLRFNYEYKRFLLETIQEECIKPWPGIKPTNNYVLNNGRKILGKVYIPESRQYRVYLCTTLYNKGVPLAYIQKYMGHLSRYMMGYYVRPKDTYQENIQYSEKIIREIAGDDITPLGGTIGEDIRKGIKKFIKENNFNVETDVKKIIEALGDKIIIRGKTGGVCIKTSLMSCSKDARTNEMMCAYNLCPNLFHFFYMIDISYVNFKTLQDTYSSNKENGKTRASQKELNKIKDLCRRRLIPELEELKKEISKKGEKKLLEQFPNLDKIVRNRSKIQEEISIWMRKK